MDMLMTLWICHTCSSILLVTLIYHSVSTEQMNTHRDQLWTVFSYEFWNIHISISLSSLSCFYYFYFNHLFFICTAFLNKLSTEYQNSHQEICFILMAKYWIKKKIPTHSFLHFNFCPLSIFLPVSLSVSFRPCTLVVMERPRASQPASQENTAAASSQGLAQWHSFCKKYRIFSRESQQSESLIFHACNCLFTRVPINNTFPKQKIMTRFAK